MRLRVPRVGLLFTAGGVVSPRSLVFEVGANGMALPTGMEGLGSA